MTRHLHAATLLILVVACLLAACGSTPTSPTPPPPAQPPPLSMTFASDTGGYAGVRSFSFTTGGLSNGLLVVNVMANQFDRAVSMFRGTVVYDPRVVELVNYGEGDFLKQNGALATFSVTSSNGRATIRVDKPTSVLGSTGSGVVVQLRFRAITPGTSPLQWTDTNAYSSTFTDQLFGTQGASITVR